MIVRNHAPPHQGRDDWNAGDLGELDQQFGSVGIDDAAAGDDQRAFGGFEHRQRLLDLAPARRRPVNRQRLVGIDVELDLGGLNVERQIDQHGAGPARAHEVEGLLEHPRNQSRLAHRDGPFGDRFGDGLDVDGLEVLLVQLGARRLARDAQDGDAVGGGGIQASDHVGPGRAGGADADTDIARLGPAVAIGHVRCAFDMAGQDVADASMGAHRRVEWIDGGSRDPEAD